MKKNLSKNQLVPDAFLCASDDQAWKANGVIQIIFCEKDLKKNKSVTSTSKILCDKKLSETGGCC